MNRPVIFICVGILVFLFVVVAAQALTWNATSSLPEGRRGISLVYYNGYVYCIGGRPVGETDTTHAVDTVYYAAVNSDGSIGTWVVASSLPGARANGGAAAYDGRLYFWGGWGIDYTVYNNCYYAPINPNGSLGSWVTSSVTIPNSAGGNSQMDAMGYGVMNWGKYLYVVNGEDGVFALQNAVLYSEIQPDGDFGSWASATATSTASWFHGVQAYAGATANYLYRIAGNYSATSEKDVFYAQINPDGSLGSWFEATGDVGEDGRYEFACALALDKIYVIGGLYGGTLQDTVYLGEINPSTGDIASFTTDVNPYPAARARFSAVSYEANGSIYILAVGGGGLDLTDPVYAECYYTQIGAAPGPTPTLLGVHPDWQIYR